MKSSTLLFALALSSRALAGEWKMQKKRSTYRYQYCLFETDIITVLARPRVLLFQAALTSCHQLLA